MSATPVTSSSASSTRDRFGLGAFVVLLLTFVIYLPALRGEFLWDDDILIYGNELIHKSDGLKSIWFSTQPHDYFPLTLTTFWFEWRMWQMETFGYHALNILLHGIGAVLLWRVLRRINLSGAFVAAALFAVHPVCVASVAWISERKNTLSLVFFLASIYWYLRAEEKAVAEKPAADNSATETPSAPPPSTTRFYVFSVVLFLCGLLSKTSVVVLPPILLGLAWARRGTVTRQDIIRTVPFFILSFAFGLVTIWFQTNKAIAAESDPVLVRLLGGGWAIWFYLLKAFAPTKLSMVYPRWSIDPHSALAWIGWPLWLALLGVTYKLRHVWARPVFWMLAYFTVTLLPVLGFFDMAYFAYSRVADHFAYLSLIGVVVLAAALFAGKNNKAARPAANSAFVPLSTAAIAACAFFSWNQSQIFTMPERLWSDTLKKNPKAWVAHSNLGKAMADAEHPDQAIDLFKNALNLNPNYAEAWNNLGSAYSDVKRFDDAIDCFKKALAIRPNYETAEDNWGLALVRKGEMREAVAHFETALKYLPDFPQAHYNLGTALMQQQKLPEAAEHYRAALNTNPQYVDARMNLALALSDMDKLDEAVTEFNETIRVEPELAEAYNGLGIVMVKKKDWGEAIRYFREALRLDPQNPNYGRNLERAEDRQRSSR